MSLTPAQRRNLALYRHYHQSPPQMTTILRRSGRRYVIALALALLAFALSPALGDTRPALFLLGLIVGLVSRDIALFAHFLRVWPATEAVINWARVDELLGEAPGDAA